MQEASFGYRMTKLRKHLGHTQQGLADLTESKRSQIADMESERSKPTQQFLEALCAATSANVDWLLNGVGDMLRNDAIAYQKWDSERSHAFIFGDEKKRRELYKQSLHEPMSVEDHVASAWAKMPDTSAKKTRDKNPGTQDDFLYVDFFDLSVSAGAGRMALADSPTCKIAYRRDYLHRRNLTASNLVELPIAGDSMSPELESGDTVLVDRSRTNVAGDGIYVLAIDELLYCKRLQLLPGRVMRVISVNQAYASYDVKLPEADGQDAGSIEIIGRVVRQGRDR